MSELPGLFLRPPRQAGTRTQTISSIKQGLVSDGVEPISCVPPAFYGKRIRLAQYNLAWRCSTSLQKWRRPARGQEGPQRLPHRPRAPRVCRGAAQAPGRERTQKNTGPVPRQPALGQTHRTLDNLCLRHAAQLSTPELSLKTCLRRLSLEREALSFPLKALQSPVLLSISIVKLVFHISRSTS